MNRVPLMLLLPLLPWVATAADRNWTAGSGNWNTGANWDVNPGAADVARVNNGGTATILATPGSSYLSIRAGTSGGGSLSGTITIGDLSNAPLVSTTNGTGNEVYIGNATTGSSTGLGTLNLANGTLSIANAVGGRLFVGNAAGGSGGTARGVVNQTGGTVALLGNGTDSRGQLLVGTNAGRGTYLMSGGVITSIAGGSADNGSGRLAVAVNNGATGLFQMTGGTASFPNRVSLGQGGGATGTITVDGGTLNTGILFQARDGGSGVFNMVSGTYNNPSDHLVSFGSNNNSAVLGGTVNISGGVINFTGANNGFSLSQKGINNNAVVDMTGGVVNSKRLVYLNEASSNVSTMQARFNQSGGTHNVQNDISRLLTGGTVEYNLSGNGVLSVSGNILLGTGRVSVSGGTASANALSMTTGTVNITGGSLAVNSLALTGAGTVTLNGGHLRANGMSLASGTFNWGAGTLTVRQAQQNADNGTTDYTLAAAPSGPQLRHGTLLDHTGANGLATGAGSVLDMGGLYLNNGVRFDAFRSAGSLDVSSAGDVYKLISTVYLLRPFGFFTEDYGSIPLVAANAITGTFDTLLGFADDGRGYTQLATQVGGAVVNPATLNLDEGMFQYATGVVNPLGFTAGTYDILYFHYRVAGTVPEPGSFALIAAGLLGMRVARNLRRMQVA